MARLKDFIPDYQEQKINDVSSKDNNLIKKPVGKKRRIWLQDSIESSLKVVEQKKINVKKKNRSMADNINKKNICFSDLRGIPLRIAVFFFSRVENKAEHKTSQVRMAEIMKSLDITKSSGRMGLRFLLKNNIVDRVELVVGRNGWSRYKLQDNIFKEIEDAILKGDLTPHVPVVRSSYKSSDADIIDNVQIKDKWSSIKFDGLKNYNFSINHVHQIAKQNNISPEDFQLSIDYFVFDLIENNKISEIKKSPVEFFMGIIRKHGMYNAPKNFESPENKMLRLKLEREKLAQEKREKMESELINLEFKNWEKEFSVDEKIKLMPEDVKNSKFEGQKISFIRTYFKDNIWPKIQQEKYADCY